MRWLRSFFRAKSVIGIAGDTLAFALESAQDTHPNEYMGMLRGTQAGELDLDEEGIVITDILVIPGTESDPFSATVKEWVKPNDTAAVGSVHSHPSGTLRPSNADLSTFGKGEVHIILGAPYGWNDWQAFDNDGQPTELPVLDVALPDPESFFHFDQADIDAELREERR